MKSWLSSKTIWFNVIMTVIDIATFLTATYPTNQIIATVSILVHGIGNIVIRYFFTSQPIQ